MTHLWVSDIILPILNETLYNTSCDQVNFHLRDVCDYALIEFASVQKVIAIFYCKDYVDILDVSPNTTRVFLGRIFLTLPDANYTSYQILFSDPKLSHTSNNDVKNGSVTIALSCLAQPLCVSCCVLLKLSFDLDSTRSTNFLCHAIHVQGSFGIFCTNNNQCFNSSKIQMELLNSDGTFCVQDANQLTVWTFSLHDEAFSQTLSEEKKIIRFDELTLLGAPLCYSVITQKGNKENITPSSALGYIKNVFLPSPKFNDNTCWISCWEHLCIKKCLLSSYDNTRGIFTYSIKRNFYMEKAFESNDISVSHVCHICQTKVENCDIAHSYEIQRMIGFLDMSCSTQKQVGLFIHLGSIESRHLQIESLPELGNCCYQFILNCWVEESKHTTRIEMSPSGLTLCVAHLSFEIFYAKILKANKDHLTKQDLQELFHFALEFIIFQRKTTETFSSSQFSEITRVHPPTLYGMLSYHLDIKVTDDTIWALYTNSSELGEKRLVRFSFDGMHEELLPALPTLEKNECMKPMLNSEIMCTTIERDTKEEWNTSHRRSSTVTNEFQMSFKECSPYTIIENDTTTNIPLSKPFITQALHFPQDAHMFQQKYTLCCLPPIYLGLLRLILDHLSSQPYDETYMNTITQKFLTCTASLFSSFLQIPGLSQFFYYTYLRNACLQFIDLYDSRTEDYDKEELSVLLEIVLTLAIRDASDCVGVLGPQSIAYGAAKAANFLQTQYRNMLSKETNKLYLSSCYSITNICQGECNQFYNNSENHLIFSGLYRPVILTSFYHVFITLPLTNVFSIWDMSLIFWLHTSSSLASNFKQSGIFQMTSERIISDWISFMLLKFNSFISCSTRLSSEQSEDIVPIPCHVLYDVLNELYECFNEDITPISTLLTLLLDLQKVNFSSFCHEDLSVPYSKTLLIKSHYVYDTLEQLASLSSSLSNLTTKLTKFRSYFKQIIHLDIDKLPDEELLKNIDHVLSSTYQINELQEQKDMSTYEEQMPLYEQTITPYHSMISFSINFEFDTASCTLFNFLYFLFWISKQFSSTFRRFETFQSEKSDTNKTLEPHQDSVWWNICVGAGSGSECTMDGLALGSNGQLTQQNIKQFLQIQQDFELKFSISRAVKLYLTQSKILNKTETLALILQSAFLSSYQKNIVNPIPSSSFLTSNILLNAVFLYDTYMAGSQLCSLWLEAKQMLSEDTITSHLMGVLFYIKGVCEAFWLRSVKYCEKEMPFISKRQHLDWNTIYNIFLNALNDDTWNLQYDLYCFKTNQIPYLTMLTKDEVTLSCFHHISNFLYHLRECVQNTRFTNDTNSMISSMTSEDRLIHLLSGKIHYCFHTAWVLKITNAPVSIQVLPLQDAADFFETMNAIPCIDKIKLQQAQKNLYFLIFYSWCHTSPITIEALQKCCELLENSSHLRKCATKVVFLFFQIILDALENGISGVDEIFTIIEPISCPEIIGVLLTYMARFTLIVPPTCIRSRFITQLLHTILMKRLNNPYEVALHCVIMACLLEIQMKRTSFESPLFHYQEDKKQLPPTLLQGLTSLLERIQFYDTTAHNNSSNIWHQLQTFVPNARGIGADSIELLNIQKNFIHNALVHLELCQKDKNIQSLLIPYFYFGAPLYNDLLDSKNIKNTASVLSCSIDKQTLQFLDIMAVLKLELLTCVNRSTQDYDLRLSYQKHVLNASAQHTVSLLAFSGLVQRAIWCLRTWTFLKNNKIFQIFLYSFISSRYASLDSVKTNIPFISAIDIQNVDSSKRLKLPKDETQNIYEIQNTNDSEIETNSQVFFNDVHKQTTEDIQLLTNNFPKTLFKESTETIWTSFMNTVDSFYLDKMDQFSKIQLFDIFFTLILYKEKYFIPISTAVTTWMLTHPIHNQFPLDFIERLLQPYPSINSDQILTEFLTYQLDSGKTSCTNVLSTYRILLLDSKQSNINQELYRMYVRKKLNTFLSQHDSSFISVS